MTDLAFVEANTILRGVTGSHAYGTATPDSDHDEMAIFIESKKQVIGLNPCNSYVNRPRAPGEKAQPGDVELTAYSLRHFARLCMNGNPTVMEMLFLPTYTVSTPVGKLVRKLRNDFVSYRAGNNYLGYLIAQKQKMKGERSQTTKRPDLVEKYGYDTKFAMHSVRLGLQGLEFLQTRAIQLPTPHAGELLKIRDGGYSEGEILEIIEGLESRLQTWVEVNKDVDHSVDRGKIDQLLVHLHEEHWNAQRT